jgi:hypothetical protein
VAPPDGSSDWVALAEYGNGNSVAVRKLEDCLIGLAGNNRRLRLDTKVVTAASTLRRVRLSRRPSVARANRNVVSIASTTVMQAMTSYRGLRAWRRLRNRIELPG